MTNVSSAITSDPIQYSYSGSYHGPPFAISMPEDGGTIVQSRRRTLAAGTTTPPSCKSTSDQMNSVTGALSNSRSQNTDGQENVPYWNEPSTSEGSFAAAAAAAGSSTYWPGDHYYPASSSYEYASIPTNQGPYYGDISPRSRHGPNIIKDGGFDDRGPIADSNVLDHPYNTVNSYQGQGNEVSCSGSQVNQSFYDSRAQRRSSTNAFTSEYNPPSSNPEHQTLQQRSLDVTHSHNAGYQLLETSSTVGGVPEITSMGAASHPNLHNAVPYISSGFGGHRDIPSYDQSSTIPYGESRRDRKGTYRRLRPHP